MNNDKAYLLGLIIGGGIFGNAEDVFCIRLPFKKWGSYLDNPKRVGQISLDIMKVVSPMFRSIYGLTVSFEASENLWTILCHGDNSLLKEDLESYGISCEGEICANVDIGTISAELIDDNLKRRFVAGLADSIGSMAKSHRRFNDSHQILSFEVKGNNFNFVCELCGLLHSINCIPDQVNWNHPNIHCTKDPYYTAWNKGFKLRILLDQYAKFGAFAFRTKAESSIENRSLQQQVHTALPCLEQKVKITPSCIHPAEHDSYLPRLVRGGHYIHYRHFCAVLGCKHAPYDKIKAEFAKLGELIIPFPIICRGSIDEIEAIIAKDSLLAERNYSHFNVNVALLLAQFKDDNNALLYGTNLENGYPIKEILNSLAYIIANENELYGKRPKGYLDIIKRHVADNPDLNVTIHKPDLLTPLKIIGNGRGALVGPKNPKVYEKLITFSSENEYKLVARPITVADLQNEE